MFEGANCAKARNTYELDREPTEEHSRHTFVYGRNVLERRHKQHENYAHAEYLNASTGHVKHKSLHGKRFCWTNGQIPSAFLLHLIVLGGRSGS